MMSTHEGRDGKKPPIRVVDRRRQNLDRRCEIAEYLEDAKGADPLPTILEPNDVAGTWLASLIWAQKRGAKGEDPTLVPASRVTNAIEVFSHDARWKGVIAYDAFAESIVSRKMPPWHATELAGAVVGDWTEEDTTRAASWLARAYGLTVSGGQILEAVAVVARRNEFHPVRDYLRGLEWDGAPRLETWLDLLGVPPTPYTKAVGKCFLIGAVARVMRPGCKADSMLVLEGETGIRKSTALNTLAGDAWFAEISGAIDPKGTAELLRRKWIVEFSELAALRRTKDQEVIKSFLSRRIDTYRPSYGKLSRDFPRQVAFAGSTNEERYLFDVTGGRRFWPIRCSKVNIRGLEIERDQLWAEAVEAFDRGEPWHLTDEEIATLAANEQSERYDDDVWTERVREFCEARLAVGVTTDEILSECLRLEIGKWTQADKTRVGAVLRRIGWRPKGRGRPRKYYDPQKQPPPDP